MKTPEHPCKVCNGTGRDAATTEKARMSSGYIMCRACLGNGLDAAEYFRWGDHPKLSNEFQQIEDGTWEADRND